MLINCASSLSQSAKALSGRDEWRGIVVANNPRNYSNEGGKKKGGEEGEKGPVRAESCKLNLPVGNSSKQLDLQKLIMKEDHEMEMKEMPLPGLDFPVSSWLYSVLSSCTKGWVVSFLSPSCHRCSGAITCYCIS